MAVYKEDKTNTWRVIYRYTDWNGERKQTQKRGFKTKREAQSWEREQLNKLGGDLDMTFNSFVGHYADDMQTRLKENTWETKKHIIDKKLVPYFGKLKMCNITAQQIITWQNELINYKDDKGKPYSPVYLKTIHNQLSAIFNHAVRYYNLKENPCQKAGSMGKKKNREMLFWTKDEYLKFADVMMDTTEDIAGLSSWGKDFDLYAIQSIHGETHVFGCIQSKTSIRDRVGRDVTFSRNAMDGLFWSAAVTLDGAFLNMPEFIHMVNGGGSYSLNGWHGMYAMSGIQESNERIYKVDDSLNLFVDHAIAAARQFISDRRMLNHEWKA